MGKKYFMKSGILLFIIICITTSILLSITGCTINEEELISNGDGSLSREKESITGEEISQNKSEEASGIYPFTITDSKGRTVTIESEPETIVSLGPNITETVYALDLGERLVGRTDYCDYPEKVKEVASIGPIMEPNLEAIADLNPDIVIGSTHFDEKARESLENLGIKVVFLYAEEDFEGVYNMIKNIGELLNVSSKAEKLVSDMKETVQDVLERVDGLDKPEVYYVIAYGPGNYTAGRDTFIARMLGMAGGKNAADDVEGWKYSLEKLVEKDPDILICSKFFNAKAGLLSAEGYKDLTAVKEGRLYEIDNNILDRQGPRLAEGLRELAEIIHPEAFK